MQESEVIEVDGVFVGTAIGKSKLGERLFFAIDQRLRSMHGQILPSLADLKLQAQREFRGMPTLPSR
nr:hypothetical protein [uncultured Lichenicoccus sp.]